MIALPLHPHAFEATDPVRVAATVLARVASTSTAAACRLHRLVSSVPSARATPAARHDHGVDLPLVSVPHFTVRD